MVRVLLVEDDDLVRDMLREELSDLGHAVDCATSKAEAEALLRVRSHDLLFCDLVLPDGKGRELASRALEYGIRPILMTGHQDVSDEMLFAGVLHLTKPFSLETLRDILTKYLGEDAPRGSLSTARRGRKHAVPAATEAHAGHEASAQQPGLARPSTSRRHKQP
jgi:two-component system response regulator AtoC